MIIYNDILPFIEGYNVVNIFGIMFAKKELKPLKEYIINHEKIHNAQMRELLYIPFYIAYGVEYLWNLCKYHNNDDAYDNISFEKEAYAHQYDLTYLNNRKHYAQWK